ncbi:Ribonuclease H domain, partial [Arabidopsis thaliana x Arabidopsis arenosa]
TRHLLFQCRVSREIWEHALNQSASDGSWTSPTEKAGIGWVLYNKHAQFIFKGLAAINPMATSLETEAEALRLAMIHINRLGYRNVTFCGDALNLFARIQQSQFHHSHQGREHSALSTHIEDIRVLAAKYAHVRFVKVPRELNFVADKLAKDAKVRKLNFVISWSDVT